jgi:hypothetical protein
MSASLQNLVEKSCELATLRSEAVERLQELVGANDTQLDLSKLVPGTDRSLAEIDARVIAICEMTSTIDPHIATALVPEIFITGPIKPLTQLASQYQTICTSLADSDHFKDGQANIDPDAITLQSKNGQVNLQLAPIFQRIWSNSDAVLATIYPLINLLRGEGQPDFSAALHVFSTAVEQVHTQRSKVAELTSARP